MTPQDFIAKWQRANLSERSACQQHFLDLCDVLGQPKPAERFGLLADGMRVRGVEAPVAAHFLMKLMFCMFGEDIGFAPRARPVSRVGRKQLLLLQAVTNLGVP